MKLPLLQLVLALVVGSVALGGFAVLAARRGYDVRRLLEPEEWRVAAELVAIVVLLLVLMQTYVSLDVPAGQLIYGRF